MSSSTIPRAQMHDLTGLGRSGLREAGGAGSPATDDLVEPLI
jgi:hypothetical protein